MGAPRAELLQEAIDLTTGDRLESYGEPVEKMQLAANIANAILRRDLTAWEVSIVQLSFKLARTATNKTHRDSTVDAMAYAGIAFECALDEIAPANRGTPLT